MSRETLQADELRAGVETILADELEIEPDELRPTADLAETYEADSLTLLAIVARLKRDLGIVVPVEEAPKMTTLDNVLALVEQYPRV